MYVIGTAGHVDHGKSRLVQALTGIDPDRLQEEKARGMTIDLGFAWLTLPSGREVSIVDVPGHERFIKNMLAGVGGIDLALLIVAADEGVMPQTREHLAILDLLQVQHGVVALAKADLVESDWLDLVEADVRETLSSTTLATAAIVRCSIVSGEGLEALQAALDGALDGMPPKRDLGRPRLPIDRVFTISGFGTVVTGTLVDGPLHVGEQVALVPGDHSARVRGLQTHKRKVESAKAGTRTAVNLGGVDPEDLERGMVLTVPGWLHPTTALDVRLRAVAGMPRPIKHNASVSFHCGAAEVSGRIRLLDQEQLEPGQEGWAQIRLAAPVAAARGDYFVVRSSEDTIGGGQVVDTRPRRHRRNRPETLDALARLLHGTPDDTALAHLQRIEPASLAELRGRSELEPDALREAVGRQVADETMVRLDAARADEGELEDSSLLMTAEGFAALAGKAEALTETFVAEHPLRPGIPKEELRSRLRLPAKTFAALERALVRRGQLTARAGALDLPERRAELSGEQRLAAERLLADLRAGGSQPPSSNEVDPELLRYLETEGTIVRVADGVHFAPEVHAQLVEKVVEALRSEGEITLAQVRDLLGTSRKYAQAFLEDLDQRRVTRRVGDARVLRQQNRTGG